MTLLASYSCHNPLRCLASLQSRDTLEDTVAQALNIAAFQAKTPAPTKPETKVEWQTFDIDTLSDDLKAQYYDYRRAQDAANKLRLAFEKSMNDKVELPSHLALAFGYKFGKLSVALVPAERPHARKATMSLSQLLARIG